MPFGHPGLPLRATAWVRAGRDGRMAVLIEQQDGRCGRWFRRWTIRRLEVDIPRTRVTDVGAWLFLGHQPLYLAVMADPNFLAHFAEQLPNGERLLGCPGGGNFDRDRTQMVGHCAHNL